VVLLDRENELFPSPATNILLSNDPNHLAYLIYTSVLLESQGRHDPAPRAGQFLLSMPKPWMAASDTLLA